MATEKGVVTATKLNVRKGAGTSHSRVGQLTRGDIVSIKSRSGNWYEISKTGITGFCHSRYIKVISDIPAGFLHEIPSFQRVSLAASADNRISRTGLTGRSAQIKSVWNSYGGLIGALSEYLSIDPSVAVAVVLVESAGKATGAEGRMTIRFENHIFYSNWGKFNPVLFYQHFRFSSYKRWQGHKFRRSLRSRWASFHGNQSKEWSVFDFAKNYSESAAIHSISMGLAQIMGFNYSLIGYESPKKMFDRFNAGPRYQLIGMFDFTKGAGSTSPMLEALRRKDYLTFATYYNGSGAAASYSERIRGYADLAATLIPT